MPFPTFAPQSALLPRRQNISKMFRLLLTFCSSSAFTLLLFSQNFWCACHLAWTMWITVVVSSSASDTEAFMACVRASGAFVTSHHTFESLWMTWPYAEDANCGKSPCAGGVLCCMYVCVVVFVFVRWWWWWGVPLPYNRPAAPEQCTQRRALRGSRGG